MRSLMFLIVVALAAPAFAEDGCPSDGDRTKPIVQEGGACSAKTGPCAQGFFCLPAPTKSTCKCGNFPDPMKGKKKK